MTAKLLMVFASTVIFGSEFHGTHDSILLSDFCGSLQTPKYFRKADHLYILIYIYITAVLLSGGIFPAKVEMSVPNLTFCNAAII
jgi:hypothetical protein